jgi:hypothetical protein
MALQGTPQAMKLLLERGGMVNKVTAFCLGTGANCRYLL